jgi:hypothetical protein
MARVVARITRITRCLRRLARLASVRTVPHEKERHVRSAHDAAVCESFVIIIFGLLTYGGRDRHNLA